MEAMDLIHAAEAMGAQIIGEASGTVTSVCTDTRQIQPGALFFALQGEHSDGHAYLETAFAGGANAAVVSRAVKSAAGPLLLVPDTLRALGDLACSYRRQFEIPVLGITGSVGKTSTKEMIAAVLRTTCRTLASAKNFNNEIGVPLTLFQLTGEHQAAVIEMGMRGLGEIDRLAEITRPSMGLITNIGYAHIERLGSREKIAEAKSELLAHLPVNGIAILPYYDPFFEYLRSRVPFGCPIWTYGEVPANETRNALRPDIFGVATQAGFTVSVDGQEFALRLQAPGQHHRHNALAALAVACTLHIPLDRALEALGHWTGAEGRMTIRHAPHGLTILDDCYNAGPESMTSALATLQQIASGRRIAVLGDMRELGDFAPEAHRIVGQVAGRTGLDYLITVGALAGGIADEALSCSGHNGMQVPKIIRFSGTEEAVAEMPALVDPGDTILVKGSRAMEMEKIVSVLTGDTAGTPHG